MDFPTTVMFDLARVGLEAQQISLQIHSGVTTFLGPNGAGKTQLLRALKPTLSDLLGGRTVRYVSAGRLGPMENYRSNFDGQRGPHPQYDNAYFGHKGDLGRRHVAESVLGDFATLAVRPDVLLKVQERLSKLFRREMRLDWDAGRLSVHFTRSGAQNSYSSAREASGLLHLTAVLTSLYDDDVAALLIDEPEVSLHPQLQSFVMQEIENVAGDPDLPSKKLIFMCTHSTEFVCVRTPEDLASLVFCNDVQSHPLQLEVDMEEFQGRQLRGLIARLGQDHKLALFSERPLLVEGPSDQIMCQGLDRRLGLYMEAAGSQVLPVIGKGQFPVVIKLMRLVGKRPVVIADADALVDDLNLAGCFSSLPGANERAAASGHRDAATFIRDVMRDFTQLVQSNWADIEADATTHPYWINRDENEAALIAQKRAAFSVLMTMEDADVAGVANAGRWRAIRKRLDSVLSLLAAVGCFILRKGALESYYLHADELTREEKPNAAAHETTNLDGKSDQEIVETYTELVAAVSYAAQAAPINEALAVRDLVLAVAAPALASLSGTSTSESLNGTALRLVGPVSSLFDLDAEHGQEAPVLKISLQSKILDVDGFPIRISKGQDLINVVNQRLNLD